MGLPCLAPSLYYVEGCKAGKAMHAPAVAWSERDGVVGAGSEEGSGATAAVLADLTLAGRKVVLHHPDGGDNGDDGVF